ncbi:NUDIX hydrolase [Sciscionella marina]|uniref:NUDIX hydrolase n=1 Tax=Sciscionella marina TaxID=508770 RepID=UPI00036C1C97|nr:NUDIX domain-containing protein [Sciscionella marina]
MPSYATTDSPDIGHEVLASVFQVRADEAGALGLHALLWRRARRPESGKWALPGGRLCADEDVANSISRQLAEKVDVRECQHLEQLAVFSAPDRTGSTRLLATAFLGLVPADADPELPEDTAWQSVDRLPPTAFDHGEIVLHARDRLRAKLSYTNIGFAIAPAEFTVAGLRELYSAALGYPISATNLQRVLTRRGLLEPTGTTSPSGGRPAAQYRFTRRDMLVTDPSAVFKPPE